MDATVMSEIAALDGIDTPFTPTMRKDADHENVEPNSVGAFDEREEKLLLSLGRAKNRNVCVREFYRMLAAVGLRKDDERLRESIGSIEDYLKRQNEAEDGTQTLEIPDDIF